MVRTLKTYSVLLNYNDNDRSQGDWGWTGRATDRTDAERKARAAMLKAAGQDGDSVLECTEGAIWQAGKMEAILRELLEWRDRMGGWDAPPWDKARKLITEIDGED